MEIKYKITENNAKVGDIIVTEKRMYLLIDSSSITEGYPIAMYDIRQNRINFTTTQTALSVGCHLFNERIDEIIPSDRISLVIDKYRK